jgi:glycerate kinase
VTAIVEAAEIVGITDPDGMALDVTARSTDGCRRNDPRTARCRCAPIHDRRRRQQHQRRRRRDADGARNQARRRRRPARLADTSRLGERRTRGCVRPRSPAFRIRDHDHVGRQQSALWRARSDGVFGPQKGVRPGDIETIDATLARYAALVERAVGRRVAERPGAGAAGGLGFALQLAGASFRSVPRSSPT